MTVSGILIRLTVVLCLFQCPLLEVSSVFSYFDEVLMASLCLCFLMKTAKTHKIEREDLLVCGCLILLTFLGLYCNMVSGVSRPAAAILQDMLTLPKAYICYLGAKYLFCDREDCWEILKWAANVVGLIVVAGIVCLPLAHFGLMDMLSRSERMGVRCYEFIYGSPGMLSQYCVLFTTLLTANLSRENLGRGRWIVWALSLVLWAATMRTRAFVMILLVIFLTFVVFRPGLRDKFQGRAMLKRLTSPLVLVPVASVVLLVSIDQIDHYFGELESARSYLLAGGLKAFWEFFPLGGGFGTYGTEAARVYYSPLYSRYGVNSHWALGVDGSELTDTFWPAIMAEFGLVGTVLYLVVVFIVLRRIIKACSTRRFLLTAAVSFVAYTLIASTATGVFFSYTISCGMLLVGLVMGCASHVDRHAISDQKGVM